MDKIEPMFRIEKNNNELYVIYCDSFENPECNVIDGIRVRKTTGKHSSFAHINTLLACSYCNKVECKFHYKAGTFFTEPPLFGRELCSNCQIMYISAGFLIVYENLKKAGLLPQDYAPICCYCYRSRKINQAGDGISELFVRQ